VTEGQNFLNSFLAEGQLAEPTDLYKYSSRCRTSYSRRIVSR